MRDYSVAVRPHAPSGDSTNKKFRQDECRGPCFVLGWASFLAGGRRVHLTVDQITLRTLPSSCCVVIGRSGLGPGRHWRNQQAAGCRAPTANGVIPKTKAVASFSNPTRALELGGCHLSRFGHTKGKQDMEHEMGRVIRSGGLFYVVIGESKGHA